MHSIYNFVSGPLVWIAFIIFLAVSIYRIFDIIILANKKEKFIFSYMSWKYGLRSVIRWITPFGTKNMRNHPVITVFAFTFHICLIITPIFLLSHIVLLDEAWSIKWISLPDKAADIMTIIVILSCLFFLVRRIKSAEVKYVTSASDYIILAITAAPFITGFFAYHQYFSCELFTILHILSAEIMLIAIPFTRLIHMLFSPLTRAYMGSEFGGVRKARDW